LPFWLALQFLTIIPVPRQREAVPAELGWSLAFFPLVGLILGGLLAGLAYGLGLILPPLLSAAIVLGVWVLLTGAHHLDGWMDSCDGFAAGRTRAERLRIMAAPDVGALGVSGAVVLLLVKYAALCGSGLTPALILAPVMGRWVAVWVIKVFPTAREQGMGFAYKQGARTLPLLLATILTVAVAVGLCRWWGIAILLAALAVGTVYGQLVRRLLGGLTGDSYGAVIELTETSVLVVMAGMGSWLG
jgi:adenosylcobinamide-GDP ribazoletransferase